MRRLLIVCSVAVLAASVFSVLAIAQRTATSAAADQTDSDAESLATPANPGEMHTPIVLATGIAVRSVALDSHANVYLTNASAPNRIFTLTGLTNLSSNSASNSLAPGRLALIAGTGTSGSLGDGGTALASQFNMKLDSLFLRSGIAIAPDGTMLVADTLNSTIRRIAGSDSSEPGVVRSIAGHWGPRQEVSLTEPLGLALDQAGNLYIADRAAGTVDVLPFASDSSSTTQLAILAHVASPASIALTTDGTEAFVASPDTGSVFEIDTQTRAIRTVPGFTAQTNAQQSTPCAQQTSGQSRSLAACPSGLAVDGGGNLFVSDASSGRILRVDAKSQQLTIPVSGLKSPGDMSFDASGNLYVAEQGTKRILKFAAMGDPASSLTITPPAALPPPPAPRSCPAAPTLPTLPFNFCDQPTGGSTPTQVFTLTAASAVSGISISISGGDFQQVSNNCGSSLAAMAQCQINIDFAPSATGSRSATLSVTDSGGDSATASLFGTGDDYQVVLNGTNQEQTTFQGGAITYKFNVTPDTVFGGVVTIVCPASSQMPALTTCTSNPATVTVTPGTPAPFSITFATTYDGILAGTTTSGSLAPLIPTNPGTPSSSPGASHWFFPAVLLLMAAPLFGWFLTRVAPRHRLTPNLAWLLLGLLIACSTIFFTSCHHSAIQAGLNTPTGTSNLTIQGSAQNAARGNTIILDVVAH